MFAALARFSIRFRWLVLAVFIVLIPIASIYAGGVFKALKQGGFDDPNSESVRARQQLVNNLGAGGADVIALYTVSPGQTVESPAASAAITAALDRAAQDASVERITSFYATGAPQLVSKDRTRTFAVISLRGDDQAKLDALDRLRPQLAADGATVQLGGGVPVAKAINTMVGADLGRAEEIAFPITAVLLIVIFGSLVSTLVPLLLGGLAIILAFTVLHIIASLTNVSVFALNIVTVLGLGLAIDYSLFILNRYREELPGRGARGALITAISTTGRAVAFSGITLAASLCGLFVFPQVFLRSMAMGGIAVTLVAMLISMTLLPAMIAILGRRIDALRVPWNRGSQAAATTEAGFWHGVAVRVMRRPLLVAVAVTAVLLLFASPFLRFRASTPDVRALASSVEARQVSDTLDASFRPHETSSHDIVLTASAPLLSTENIGNLYDYTQKIAALPGVARVDSIFSVVPGLPREGYQSLFSKPAGEQDPALARGLAGFARDSYTRLAIVSTTNPDDPLAQSQVGELRRLQPPAGMSALVGGPAASIADLKATLRDHIPAALAVVAGVMFLVLFLVFGSVTLPLKAMIMNLLSLSASYGAMVWIFQDGRLQGLLHFQSLGSVDATQPILMFAMVFGLSMDYEVLLLSRIREEYLRTGDNALAVARGLEKTGRLITSAAALLVVVIGAFATSSLVFMKELGVGMALAIALDATIVRALLVPATMRLMGHWNWWAPKPLLRVWQRAGLGDFEAHAPAAGAGD